jgi:hypothetical protein
MLSFETGKKHRLLIRKLLHWNAFFNYAIMRLVVPSSAFFQAFSHVL